MSELHMLDTDIASFLIKGRSPSLTGKLLALPPSQVCISAVTRAELQYGLKRLPADHRLHLGVAHFFHLIHVFPWDVTAADRYAEVRHQLASTGKLIGELDMMIAAHAISLNAVLVTNNTRHFECVNAPLVRTNWVVE